MRSTRLMIIQKSKMQAFENNHNPNFQFDSHNYKPYFFKVIVNPLDQKQQLRFPMEFTQKYGMQPSEEIWLNVKNSEQPWKVKLEKDNNKNNDTFLRKGWNDFVEFYNLDYGNLLVFRFDGGLSHSQFHVLIFDKTAVEIDYPVRKSSSKTKITEENDYEDGVSVEILDQNYSTRVDKTEVEIVDLDSSSNSDEFDSSSYKGKEVRLSSTNSDYSSIANQIQGCNNSHTSSKKKDIMRKLDEFESPYPHFKTIMYPSNVRHIRCKRAVPFEHATKYFTSNSKEITLRGPNGTKYKARFYVGKRNAELVTGWKNFVVDNQLRIGDACVFELINSSSYLYDVTIFRRR